MYNFEFVKPSSVDEAVAALKDEDAQPLSGGQTLIPTLKQRLNQPSRLVSLLGIADLVGLSESGGEMTIKGATNHATVAAEAASSFPGLAALAGKIGDPAVRNRGTIGGSIANNDPSACYPAAAMACQATIVTNTREIAADDFFEGMFATALDEGEIVTAVRFPVPEASNYQKFEQPASRFPLTGVFVAKYADRVGVGVTGASNDGVFRWKEAEEALASNFSPDAISGLTVPADDMISDLHGSAEYRAHLVKVLTGRGVAAC
ncbi:carbon monoxide dehydrogenase, medium subunit, putative [Pseudooceanicola batsensis HTCC2597]|uniref:Carbon monoxide dehydrogenase, medium subunit, putative n=1 Tax=Pseudooceanicola batsensis (strain ATCC BAA-863 / DSM 15984 / KCTC 12145 / HTCC2597) TaxID=252305 RepID=A3U273_PSEBH|nr:xanthine dehydrogenase family protein subunit M [Pseudooceanicola batsensis]EAQ01673.1 carbon monoxide dehydrogenase, medium subunit, putative [Pseudooceanicola batsensis HTCC2597]